jgi:hypothetical protein
MFWKPSSLAPILWNCVLPTQHDDFDLLSLYLYVIYMYSFKITTISMHDHCMNYSFYKMLTLFVEILFSNMYINSSNKNIVVSSYFTLRIWHKKFPKLFYSLKPFYLTINMAFNVFKTCVICKVYSIKVPWSKNKPSWTHGN